MRQVDSINAGCDSPWSLDGVSDPSCVRGYLHLGHIVDEPVGCVCLHEVEIDVVLPLEATNFVLPEEALLE